MKAKISGVADQKFGAKSFGFPTDRCKFSTDKVQVLKSSILPQSPMRDVQPQMLYFQHSNPWVLSCVLSGNLWQGHPTMMCRVISRLRVRMRRLATQNGLKTTSRRVMIYADKVAMPPRRRRTTYYGRTTYGTKGTAGSRGNLREQHCITFCVDRQTDRQTRRSID